MQPDQRFVEQPKRFWANVRTISQKLGYTNRGTKQIRVPEFDEVHKCMLSLGLTSTHLGSRGVHTPLGKAIFDYFAYRATVLNQYAEPRLMNKDTARAAYEELQARYAGVVHIPTNKQSGEKRTPAFFSGIINMIVNANIGSQPCDFNPMALTTFTRRGEPVRTLSRRVDGAFPSTVNPVAIWEIKEYYYTTTFGSRVADGVYESQLDGLELEEMRLEEKIHCVHVLMVDDHNTWWNMGRSYLCRIIDMLHMGYVDEVLFGREVIDVLPGLVRNWVATVDDARIES